MIKEERLKVVGRPIAAERLKVVEMERKERMIERLIAVEKLKVVGKLKVVVHKEIEERLEKREIVLFLETARIKGTVGIKDTDIHHHVLHRHHVLRQIVLLIVQIVRNIVIALKMKELNIQLEKRDKDQIEDKLNLKIQM
jgi:hypothetical protein